jgi:hypothetical protein
MAALVLSLDRGALRFTFESPQELRTWFQGEMEFWDAFHSQYTGLTGKIGNVDDSYAKEVAAFQAFHSRLPSANSGQYQEVAEAIFQDLVTEREQHKLRLSHEAPYKWVKEFFPSEPGPGVLAVLLEQRRRHVPFEKLQQLASGYSAADVLIAIDRVRPPKIRNLDLAGSDEGKRITDAMDKAGALVVAVRDAEQRIQRLKSLEETLKTKIVTAEARSFWETRAFTFRKAKWIAFLAFAAAASIGAFFYETFVQTLQSSFGDKVSPEIIMLSRVALPALLFLWFLRHIVRIFAQLLARQQDAEERVTTLDTYLALGADDKLSPTSEERLMFISTLVRPGPGTQSDGLPSEAALDLIKAVRK